MASPVQGHKTHLSPFDSGGKLCFTAATNSATVSSRVKITALGPASNVYATWNPCGQCQLLHHGSAWLCPSGLPGDPLPPTVSTGPTQSRAVALLPNNSGPGQGSRSPRQCFEGQGEIPQSWNQNAIDRSYWCSARKSTKQISVELCHRQACAGLTDTHGLRPTLWVSSAAPAPPCLGLPVVGIEAVHQVDDMPGSVIEVRDGREGVQTGGMELVAVLHGQLAKALEVSFIDIADHLCYAPRHHCLSPELQGKGASQ